MTYVAFPPGQIVKLAVLTIEATAEWPDDDWVEFKLDPDPGRTGPTLYYDFNRWTDGDTPKAALYEVDVRPNGEHVTRTDTPAFTFRIIQLRPGRYVAH